MKTAIATIASLAIGLSLAKEKAVPREIVCLAGDRVNVHHTKLQHSAHDSSQSLAASLCGDQESYAVYYDVDAPGESFDKEMFAWWFPARKNTANGPLSVWLTVRQVSPAH